MTDFEPEFVINGTVRRAGDMIRVTAKLVKYGSGAIVLSRSYDRRAHDIFEIQDDLVGKIITETQVALTRGEVARLAVRQTRSVQAWEYFHRGVLEHTKYKIDSFQVARRMYRKALDIDPDYYDAMVADGWALWMDARMSTKVNQLDALRECRVLVDTLISQWPDRPDTFHLDAVLLMMEGEHEAAEIRADQGRAAGQCYLWGYAVVHIYGGSVKKATELFEKLINTSLVLNNDALYCYAHCLTLMGEFEQAIILAEEYRLRVPATVYGYTLLATAQGNGRPDFSCCRNRCSHAPNASAFYPCDVSPSRTISGNRNPKPHNRSTIKGGDSRLTNWNTNAKLAGWVVSQERWCSTSKITASTAQPPLGHVNFVDGPMAAPSKDWGPFIQHERRKMPQSSTPRNYHQAGLRAEITHEEVGDQIHSRLVLGSQKMCASLARSPGA